MRNRLKKYLYYGGIDDAVRREDVLGQRLWIFIMIIIVEVLVSLSLVLLDVVLDMLLEITISIQARVLNSDMIEKVVEIVIVQDYSVCHNGSSIEKLSGVFSKMENLFKTLVPVQTVVYFEQIILQHIT